MQNTFSVVLLDHLSNFDFSIEKKIWNDLPFEVLIERSNDEPLLIKSCEYADVVGVSLTSLTRKVILSMQRCRAIVRYGIGLDSICTKTAKEKNIPIINFPEYCVQEVAEHAVALSLSLLRRLSLYHNSLQQKKIWPSQKDILPLKSIRECIVGVIGFGKTGRLFAKKMEALGAKNLLIFSRTHPPDLNKLFLNTLWEPNLEEIFSKCDLVSLHIACNEQTKGIINKKYLQLMKVGSILINVSRGDLIQEQALIQVLQEKRIFAGLDVFHKEPLPNNHPFLQMDQILLSPHLAWSSQTSLRILQESAANTIREIYLQKSHAT